MAENKLTDKHLRSLKPTDKEQALGDGGGLWVRLMPASKGGAINFYYRFQFDGRERRFNCGTYPKTTLASARRERDRARDMVRAGLDPILKDEQDRISRTAAQAAQQLELTVEGLFEDWKRVYLVAHRKDGGTEVEAAIRLDVIPMIGQMKARDVRLQHAVKVIDRILNRGARRKANMVLSLMRQMFRHGMGRGIVETDPTLALSKKQAGGKETPVSRNLSLDEIRELRDKLPGAGLHERYQRAIWLLLATGTRVGELVKARWDDIDTEHATWAIPETNTKNGRAHLIHLSPFALDQLSMLSAMRSNDYLLAGRQADKPITEKTLSKAIRDRMRSVPLRRRTTKTGALRLSGGEWTAHDLRRTMATRMGDLGVEPHVIERCLNHIQQGIVGVYQRQEYIKQRQQAFGDWGEQLAEITHKCDVGGTDT